MRMCMLGNTDLNVSRLGLGLAEIGFELGLKGERQVSRVLNEALDAGINFLDTAACYGDSEGTSLSWPPRPAIRRTTIQVNRGLPRRSRTVLNAA